MANHVTLGTAYRFFMPLILMTELNMISKSVINAVLARSPDQSVTLAAFHLAFILYFALSSSTEVGPLITLAYLKTKRSLRPLLRFMIVIVAVPWGVAQVLAFTDLGDWIHAVAAKTAYIEPGFALGERILRVLQCPLQRRTA